MLFVGLCDPKTSSNLSFHVYNSGEQDSRIRFELRALHVDAASDRFKSCTPERRALLRDAA